MADTLTGVEHGTRRGYQMGCHCLLCRAANAAYVQHYRRLRAAQRYTPLMRVAAGRTWARIRGLLIEGFTKAELARRLGHRAGRLHLSRRVVSVRTAVRIRRIYDAVMAEGHELPWHREEER